MAPLRKSPFRKKKKKIVSVKNVVNPSSQYVTGAEVLKISKQT